MRTANAIVIMIVIATTAACRQHERQDEMGEPKLAPESTAVKAVSKRKPAQMNLVTNDIEDDYIEDAIDLAEARCGDEGGSWNGEDCVHCPEHKIWDRYQRSCLVY